MYSDILLTAVNIFIPNFMERWFWSKKKIGFRECGKYLVSWAKLIIRKITVTFEQSQVRVSVIQMLPSAEVDDLPVVVKFILQSVGDGDAFEVQDSETIYKPEAHIL